MAETVDIATELDMSMGDDSVSTAVVAPVSVDIDELGASDDAPVGTETVGNPGRVADLVATRFIISI